MFLLNGVLSAHLGAWANHPQANELRKALYVDDIIFGATTVDEAEKKKEVLDDILNGATFQPHKWAFNCLEQTNCVPDNGQ